MDPGSPTIHIVDDDDEVRESLHALLESYGFAVEKYSTGTEFKARYRADMQGCLLLDLHMPGLSGLDLLRYLRREVGSFLPIVIMSGGADKAAFESFLAAGASACLEKPFKTDAVLGLIRTLA